MSFPAWIQQLNRKILNVFNRSFEMFDETLSKKIDVLGLAQWITSWFIFLDCFTWNNDSNSHELNLGFSSYLHRLIILMIDYYYCLFCFNCIDLSRIHFLYMGFLSCIRYFVLFSFANLIVSPSLYYRWAALFNSELFVMCKEDIRLFWVLYFWFNLCNRVDHFKY